MDLVNFDQALQSEVIEVRQVEQAFPFIYTPATEIEFDAEGVKLYEMLPFAAKENYTFGIFEITQRIAPHVHKVPTQLLLVLEGAIEVELGNKTIFLQQGSFMVIPPNVMHAIQPVGGKALFFSVDFPGFNYPEPSHINKALTAIKHLPFIFKKVSEKRFAVDQQTTLPADIAKLMLKLTTFDPRYYSHKRIDNGYIVYDIAHHPKNKWSIAVIDIVDTPQHYHKVGTEHFIVLSGKLEMMIDGTVYQLLPGQSAHVKPGTVHQLKAAGHEAARILCIDFPAFDPNDFYQTDQSALNKDF